MKSRITLLIAACMISIIGMAATVVNGSEYYICTFSDTVSTEEITELTNSGFEVIEKDSTDNHIVYVVATRTAKFTSALKSKMNELVQVDKNGNKTYLVETLTEESPEFLKLFFNFI